MRGAFNWAKKSLKINARSTHNRGKGKPYHLDAGHILLKPPSLFMMHVVRKLVKQVQFDA